MLCVVLIHVHFAEYIMQNTRLDEAEAGIKIARRNISNLIYADDTTLMAEREIKETIPFTIAMKIIKFLGIRSDQSLSPV